MGNGAAKKAFAILEDIEIAKHKERTAALKIQIAETEASNLKLDAQSRRSCFSLVSVLIYFCFCKYLASPN
jgi:hypothetical protein